MEKKTKRSLTKLGLTTLTAGFVLVFTIIMLERIYGDEVPMWIKFITYMIYTTSSTYMIYMTERKSRLKNIITSIAIAFILGNFANMFTILIGGEYSPERIIAFTIPYTIGALFWIYYGKTLLRKKKHKPHEQN